MPDTRLSSVSELILGQGVRTLLAGVPSVCLFPGRWSTDFRSVTDRGCYPATPSPRIPESANGTTPVSYGPDVPVHRPAEQTGSRHVRPSNAFGQRPFLLPPRPRRRRCLAEDYIHIVLWDTYCYGTPCIHGRALEVVKMLTVATDNVTGCLLPPITGKSPPHAPFSEGALAMAEGMTEKKCEEKG